MLDLSLADFLALRWERCAEPLIDAPFPSPILADPSFLLPHETPSGSWILLAHDAFGLRRYESRDGLGWDGGRRILWNAMRPFIRRVDDGYLLAYEKYRPLSIPLQLLPRRPRWHSRLELRRSAELRSWSAPSTLLEPDFPWARDPRLGESVSNPCLVRAAGIWRLWFSASLVTVPDCGFDEPRYIGSASSPSLAGPWTLEGGPRIDPAADPLPGVLGAGSMKVFALRDGWLGLQNKIYAEPDRAGGIEEGGGAVGGRGTARRGASRSAIFILRSDNGLDWRLAREEPLLAPEPGWTSSHVYACDARQDPRDGRVYLYFNARDGWYKTEGRERIGRMVGRLA